MDWENQISKFRSNPEYVNVGKLAAMEDELRELQASAGMTEKRSPLLCWIDALLERKGTRVVSRRRYIRYALSCGWFTGLHRWYAGQRFTAALYLLFFWTGIPFAMTIVDLMMVLPMKPDEEGRICL